MSTKAHILLLCLVGLGGFLIGQYTSGTSAVIAEMGTMHDWSYETNQTNAAGGTAGGYAGDVNGDGHLDVYVGTYQYQNGEWQEGKIEIFYGAADGLSTQPDWVVEGNQINAKLGYKAASAGDVNGDGYDDFIVGSHGWTEGTDMYIGRALFFYGSSNGPSTTPDIIYLGENAGDQFGNSFSAGDVNGDGYSDVFIGTERYSSGEFEEGKIYGYYGSATGLATSSSWVFESNRANAMIGTSTSIGDINGDGYGDILIGGQGHNHENFYTSRTKGVGYAIHGSSTGLGTSPSWTYLKGFSGSGFGFDVALNGDINGDGYDDAIISEYLRGWVYVFHGSPTGLNSTSNEIVSGGFSTQFGASVAYAGDINNDDYDDIIVGAPINSDSGLSRNGKVYIYTGSNTGINLTPLWSKSGEVDNGFYGSEVNYAGAILDETISRFIIGAPQETNGGTSYIIYNRCEDN